MPKKVNFRSCNWHYFLSPQSVNFLNCRNWSSSREVFFSFDRSGGTETLDFFLFWHTYVEQGTAAQMNTPGKKMTNLDVLHSKPVSTLDSMVGDISWSNDWVSVINYFVEQPFVSSIMKSLFSKLVFRKITKNKIMTRFSVNSPYSSPLTVTIIW